MMKSPAANRGVSVGHSVEMIDFPGKLSTSKIGLPRRMLDCSTKGYGRK